MSSKMYMTDGTAALNNLCLHGTQTAPRIIAYEGGKARELRTASYQQDATQRPSHPQGKLRRILDSSEMYCSLKLEDFRGCPYRLFTKRGIAFLSGASSVLAVLSIVVAA